MKKIIILSFVLILCVSCAKEKNLKLDQLAEQYVKLVLEVGLYDNNFVDAYYGPAEWKKIVKEKQFPFKRLKSNTSKILTHLNEIKYPKKEIQSQRRLSFLKKQVIALGARIEFLNGAKFTFDEEAKLLFDVNPPHYTAEHFDSLLSELELVLPGKGNLQQRFEKYRHKFIIPKDKLSAVFAAAINEGRKRTKKKIALPANENFVVEYVSNKSWGAYNWYKGNNFSVIQFNTDITAYIDRAVDLACHEGYPGHHVFNSLLEGKLYKEKGWVEYSVYPLFSPQSFIAEGTANYGIEIAFNKEQRLSFEKKVLFPLAGIDSSLADNYYKILTLVAKLNYAGNEAARNYIDGNFTENQAINWMIKYLLMTPERAAKRLEFIKIYRSYVVNYNLGKDLIAKYIKKKTKNGESEWKVFEELLSAPIVPSEL